MKTGKPLDPLDSLIGSPEEPPTKDADGRRMAPGLRLVVPERAASSEELSEQYGGGIEILDMVFENPDGTHSYTNGDPCSEAEAKAPLSQRRPSPPHR
jgi:hypothetical protein